MDDLDRCKRGHLWTEKNTRLRPQQRDPTKMTRMCRWCQRILQRKKYRTDAEYREKIKADRLARYHAGKKR